MSSMNLIRLGGLAAVFAGILRAINSFIPSNAPSEWLEVIYFMTDLFILFGMIGLYGFQHRESKLWGLSGFLLVIVGVGIIIGPDGVMFGAEMYPVGSLILAIGLILFSVGSWIAHKLPRWVPVFWTGSTVLGILGYFTPGLTPLFVISGLMFGLAFAGAGIAVWWPEELDRLGAGWAR
jgi:hypothetical protein